MSACTCLTLLLLKLSQYLKIFLNLIASLKWSNALNKSLFLGSLQSCHLEMQKLSFYLSHLSTSSVSCLMCSGVKPSLTIKNFKFLISLFASKTYSVTGPVSLRSCASICFSVYWTHLLQPSCFSYELNFPKIAFNLFLRCFML